MMKKVMVRAWEIAKNAVKKFGGKARDFFSMSLSLAWKEVKQVSTSIKSQIVLAGKKGDSLFIAIPTTVTVTVTNAFNDVRKPCGTSSKDGANYNVFSIIVDARYTKFAEFNTIVDGKFESHKVDLVNRKLI